jgi:hypothetical protein
LKTKIQTKSNLDLAVRTKKITRQLWFQTQKQSNLVSDSKTKIQTKSNMDLAVGTEKIKTGKLWFQT